MNHQENLSQLRKLMQEHQVDAYIIPSADPHLSEYVPEFYKQLRFICGFSGSMGTVVVTKDFAGLWTDFRYFQQAGKELINTGFELVKLKVQYQPEYIEWLHGCLPDGATVGFDFRLLPVSLVGQIEEGLSDKQVVLRNIDFIAGIWTERPLMPSQEAFLLDESNCGMSFSEKLKQVRNKMKQQKTNTLILPALDEIAWLFNLRGSDVIFNPVVLGFAVVTTTEVKLYLAEGKLNEQDLTSLHAQGIHVYPYDDFEGHLASLPITSEILIDPKKTSHQVQHILPGQVKLKFGDSLIAPLKSIKNSVEVANIISSMLRDGVAITRFFKWLEENAGSGKVTEWMAAEKITAYRAAQEGYAGPSFAPISAYGPNAAMPHYSPDQRDETKLKSEGLYLLDSGGHYFHGTTDITRTVPLGALTDEEMIDYTLVLSAMISGSMAKFPKGTRGYQIDGICRKQMWEHGINYGHGTGHGVGYFLNVHEGPQNIGPSNVPVAIEVGMLTSMEPGIYRAGKHGVRIENLILTVEDHTTDFGEFLSFETLTLAHIDTSCIVRSLLDKKQISWLNEYHQEVYRQLSPLLNSEEQSWLSEKCKAI
ncbi:aminopeptidase P family protein [Pedobacter sp. BMA]|uniref:aminopeptidase P family protein n=1 Tax=Pedobacter sp. BMA TaxID=1663685 RepID=UPI00064A53E7|nr:aminopeptidase P family protein [Pedobacter sp. BMA]KLT67446.1 Xaa-Pro aminopeptidase [Pedobacter sp. BMA]